MSKYAECIDEAIALLAKEGGWCRGAFARTEDGLPIGTGCENAVSFCMSGAKIRVSDQRLTLEERFALHSCLVTTIQEMFPNRLNQKNIDIYAFNDHPDTTLADVISVWEAVKDRLSQQQDTNA